ncbi:CesT family type III secretion system chaperone [Parachitinimonas caeni]|uniref:CesT family type III secretion system chaperone n=1 Tax=Parachitinimonas caeni TaxID=3031301 RepID=A0ABT7DUL8_9NEIS|nr:CesT family type III secretion system chaperone [Parachitinimonas caeni]MDK2123757.1 CesT family type III secretion system chaperone [Parachitinimonas caeni]
MQAFDHLNNLVAELGRRNNIADTQLAADGSFGLKLADGTEVSFELIDDVLYLYGIICPLPPQPEQRRRVYEVLLESNCLGAGTSGGVLSLHGQLESFVYHLALAPEALDLDALETALASVGQHCAFYLGIINRLLSQAEATPVETTFGTPTMLMSA